MTAVLLPALNPSAMTGRGNNTFLLDGAEPTLIDAGVGVPEHVASIAKALGGRDLHRVVITHGHVDHVSGVPALRERWPRIEACKWLEDGETGWVPLRDGQQIRAGDSLLTIVHTPGHALDHVCLWDPATRDLYAGDMVAWGGTVMIPAGRGGGLRAYLASLDRLAALGPARILPGHGPVITRPAEVIADYIAHRRMRDEQVAACLRDGVTDPDEIVTRLYPELPAPLRSAAKATVEAHIEKLSTDGGL